MIGPHHNNIDEDIFFFIVELTIRQIFKEREYFSTIIFIRKYHCYNWNIMDYILWIIHIPKTHSNPIFRFYFKFWNRMYIHVCIGKKYFIEHTACNFKEKREYK